MTKKNLTTGHYKHFKGMPYKVFDVVYYNGAAHVIYQKQYDDMSFWIRPYDMFFEEVTLDGKTFPRFEFIEKKELSLDVTELDVTHSETLECIKLKNLNGNWTA